MPEVKGIKTIYGGIQLKIEAWNGDKQVKD
jgi:hypothetical protein